jgi:hypothetical protein
VKRTAIYLVILFLLADLAGFAQFDPKKICTLSDGQLVFRIDRRWTKDQFREVTRLFDLDSLLIERALKGDKDFTHNEISWKIKSIDKNTLEITKLLSVSKGTRSGTADVIILDDKWIKPELLSIRESERYGINRFKLFSAFSYRNGVARFFLPGHLSAPDVNIAGTFNNWSTMNTPMLKTDSGWVVSLKLKPGKYEYKYIVGGRWMTDPNNMQRDEDDYGNAIVFCPNYFFRLHGYNGAKNVRLAGSFSSWNRDGIPMHRIPGGWALLLYLHEGTHAYKYIVDGEWILDPANSVIRSDGSGNENSFLSIGDTLYFRLPGHTGLEKVVVAGDFNAWNPDELRMQRDSDGWILPYVLAAGNYEYKFIEDGKWVTDPNNPTQVNNDGNVNSFLTVKPNHTFVLDKYPDAKEVVVTGNFNGWNPKNFRMVKKEGKWQFTLYLRPGKCAYKFVVDGKWIIDPANDTKENNEYNSYNSVIWIEP